MAPSSTLVKNMADKKQIRKEIFSRRKLMSEEELNKKSQNIFKILTGLSEYQDVDQILIYVSFGKEVETHQLISHALQEGKEVLVPKVMGKDMVFVKINNLSELMPGTMGILEPEGNEEAILSQNALMIMPGVAFDINLHRVGYGGGYYDKYLEQHDSLRKIALGFEFQLFSELPCEETDIKPDILITERRILP